MTMSSTLSSSVAGSSRFFTRSHHCGELNAAHVGSQVRLTGWVAKRRDHGGVIFVDLRDRYGLTQVVVDPSKNPGALAAGERVRNEYVLFIEGVVRLRPEGMRNTKLPTGEIEIEVQNLEILSEAKPLPFPIESETEVSESLRLKYRYLDLRRGQLQRNIILRHRALSVVRQYLDRHQFLEIETPILYKSTPEGARDYVVPSRVNPGTFYALPQSPQTLKQLLMVSGFDRYYQIARCFRDEDLRADRQPEFSQIDIEMSFPEPEMFFTLMENMMAEVFKTILGVSIPTPFRRMSYATAMADYGIDKPDLRFDLKLCDLNDVFSTSTFQVYQQVLQQKGWIKGLRIPGGAEKVSRKQIDEWTKLVQQYGAKGLAWYKWAADGTISGSAAKFLSDGEKQALSRQLGSQPGIQPGDLLFVVADQTKIAHDAMAQLRLRAGRELGLIDEKQFSFLWVTGFPLLEFSPDDGRYYACHHPFTAPIPEHTADLLAGRNLGQIQAVAYDMVLNGYEVGGGSFRIFNQDVQSAMFRALGLTPDEAKQKFGFFIEGLQYGTPPHGGMAFGVDRLVMILAGTDAIRDVMAFPKTQKAQCLMSESPSEVTPEQLAELHIQVARREPK